ncbi:hypothetical protein SAMD00019534_064540 [Acytostelium subglobosum LB1]|uniref:hypothetical protein n=1 Tax=Acytostelium subglobosum LB1 TaxID=1410327 RepID=UPI0006447B96|nr:hypothetical protein SAMD00019534_064540 [Acytostelium subglobosum LB1]GAM23279.1 hypothetical protein SAMD00019534_064540 [Acytostelium subglobosum LB1]|eukprot:XP_012753728.1 hypothetical protein SAMD00019534_064540 [Acytostelium subglobosum LB1]
MIKDSGRTGVVHKHDPNKTFSITMTGNGSEPPFSNKGLVLPHFGRLRIIIPCGLDVANAQPQLYTNYPTTQASAFVRDRFDVVERASKEYNGRCDIYFELHILRYGCFDYYLEWTDPVKKVVKRGTIASFQLYPELAINGRTVPNDSIVLQTVLTKCLGPLSNWETHIAAASNTGYNMIHFTPVQEVGVSGSCYSIYDQLALASSLFEPGKAPANEEARMAALDQVIKLAESKYGVLSMIDLVWNHTANNAAWLRQHPEASYNIDNSPHLKPAIVLDDALVQYSKHIEGTVVSEVGLDTLMLRLTENCISPLKLWEYYVLDVQREIDVFKKHFPTEPEQTTEAMSPAAQLLISPKSANADLVNQIQKKGLVRDASYERYSLAIDTDFTFKMLSTNPTFKLYTYEEKKQKYEDLLRLINLNLYRDYDADHDAIINNIRERLKYERLADHGPKLGPVTADRPLLSSYFTRIEVAGNGGATRTLHLANNGWIYNHNPVIDFASKQSRAYMRRDVIVWGDCVKLRYGQSPLDNPWLWDHMRTYTERMATHFHAIRIDNCHSTPIHVAQYLLDAARTVRPTIYVTCELFTGSEEADGEFVKRLGINSLIREAMVCHDSWELGRVCHRYGGNAVASFVVPPSEDTHLYTATPQSYGIKPLKPVLPPALFMDCTHDNQTPNQKRTIEDTLPNSAVVSMTVSAIGSTRGYDEIFPETVDLVNEKRQYTKQSDFNRGLLPIKKLLNNLHVELADHKYSEVHIHQEHNVIMVQRFSPSLNKSVFLIAHTAFAEPAVVDGQAEELKLPDVLQIPCKITEFVVGARITRHEGWHRNDNYLTGVDIDVEAHYGDRVFEKYCYIESDYSLERNLQLKLKDFPPGAILIFRAEVPQECRSAMDQLTNILSDITSLEASLKPYTLLDMNFALFRHSEEEKVTDGSHGYSIPNYGTLQFCGIQGFATILNRVLEWNDLSHPLCNNLRDGNWAMDFIVSRLKTREQFSPLCEWLNSCFWLVKQLPRHFIPKYFGQVVLTAYRCLVDHTISLMSPFVQNGNWFVHALALASLQFYGVCTPLIKNPKVLEGYPHQDASLAAGFPHFCSGYMRSWGRDTFIAIRGLMLTTGRLQEAKQLIVGYGSSLQFGLIPNLLDSGTRPRYNARDSTWWYLRSLQDLAELLTSDEERRDFLNTRVTRLFPVSPDQPTTSIEDIIQEIVQSHAKGINFREPFAGRDIDDKMKDEGFNINISVNKENGFIYGGNKSNCGTWMDKMGESGKAGNYGDPATPRDGAPVEITAMVFSTVKWLAVLNQRGLYKYSGVKLGDSQEELSYKNWQQLIQDNFEKFYYIPGSSEDKKFKVNSSYIRRRYIYKDTVGSSAQYTDYQFRPNFLVSMTFAPELFSREHAVKTLELTKTFLLGPLGVKTLDPNDTDYHPNYDNSLDTEYRPTARGFNYHNGPEWLWLYGFYLDSAHKFLNYSASTTSHIVENLLLKHKSYILQSSYAALPELTNRDGNFCKDSCDSQAWSIGTLLSALYNIVNNKK